MIRRSVATVKSVSSFYDSLASHYDEMIEFEKRFDQAKPLFRNLIERYEITSAMDAGCGTGFHSLLLAKLGVRVVAVDISKNMLRRLTSRARSMKLKVATVQSSFEELRKHTQQKTDAVFCLGNSLAHLLSDNALRKAVRSFAACVKRNGILLVQMLNYDRILADGERIRSIKEANGKIFVRFYDYEEKMLRFNILTIQKEGSELRHELNSAPLRPFLSKEIFQVMNECGFGNVKLFGNLAMSRYVPNKSRDLVILAQRN